MEVQLKWFLQAVHQQDRVDFLGNLLPIPIHVLSLRAVQLYLL